MPQGLVGEAKVFLRHSSVYGLANVLNRAVGFLMLPFYTVYLVPADYGRLELLNVTTALLAILIGFGFADAVGRFYFEGRTEKERGRAVSTALVGLSTLALVITSALALVAPLGARLVLDDPGAVTEVHVALAGLFFDLLIAIAFAYLRAVQASVIVSAFSLGRLVLSLALNIVLLAAGYGVLGVLAATLIANVLAATGLLALVLRRVGFSVSRPVLREMLRFGLPLIPSQLANFLVVFSDRYFVKEYGSVAQAGLYSLGYKFGTIGHQFVTTPFTQVWTPRRIQHYDEPDANRLYARLFSYFVALLAFAALAISLFAEELLALVTTPAFRSAHQVVPVLTLAHVVLAFFYHFQVNILMEKKTSYFAWINILSGAAAVGLNFLLIPPFGAQGAAWATLGAYVVRSGTCWLFAGRLGPVVTEWGRVGGALGSAVGLFVVSRVVPFATGWPSATFDALLLAAYAGGLWLSGYFRGEPRPAAGLPAPGPWTTLDPAAAQPDAPATPSRISR
ncbi:MAG: polysaccharide biosynthesis protein [Acidobacteria bacterium]|nr:polysaccharide biosynthesis protein [Acidobacteriota bacterium]